MGRRVVITRVFVVSVSYVAVLVVVLSWLVVFSAPILTWAATNPKISVLLAYGS